MTPQTQLGDFGLESVIGAGAMGQVWRARHLLTGAPVAVKLLTGVRTRSPEHRAAFRDEIHAVAALNHPNVLRIYDYGYATEQSTDAVVAAGTPWFAAELAAGDLGSLPVDRWEVAREVVEQILDALAHAHSRGVIHRDLKPQNVLVVEEKSGLRLKLADFGIAERYRTDRDYDSAEGRGRTSGTPSFMPPEQFRGQWRDFGPPTDLYALGCLTYAILTGAPPFAGSSAVGLAMQHIDAAPPPLRPQFAVPEGIAAWVALLLRKDHARRPQTAAEAAWRLRELVGESRATIPLEDARCGEPDEPTLLAAATRIETVIPPTLVEDAGPTLAILATIPLTSAVPVIARGDSGATTVLGARPAVPIPLDWRTPIFDPSATKVELGLNLAAIREPPFVHREQARDLLWRKLLAAARDAESQTVWIHGPRGMGKTRLARWLCDRGAELGAVASFWLTHDSWWESGASIAKMLDLALRTRGLSAAEVRDRLRARWGDDYDVAAAVELVRPVVDAADDVVRATFSSRTERFHAVARLLRRLADGRVPVLVVDDIHWSSTALELVRVLHEAASGVPGFVIVAISDDEVDESTAHLGDQLRRVLVEGVGADEHMLEPLAPPEQQDLVRAILPFEDSAAMAIAAETHGVPLHAVQAVASRLDQGGFRRVKSGAFAQPGTVIAPEGSLREVIEQRIEAVERQFPGAREALELAAAPGTRVVREAWHTAARATATMIPVELEDVLLLRRLAVAERNGWSFAHPDIRASIVERSRLDGRWAAFNRACAAFVDGHESADAAQRKARLLLAGGVYAEAVEYLRLACTAHYRTDDYAMAATVLAEMFEALAAGDVPADDEVYGEALILRARIEFVGGSPAAAGPAADAALDAARLHGWPTVEAQALEIKGRLAVNIDGEIERAIEHYQAGLDAAARASDPLLEARILEGLAFISVHHRGDAAAARADLRRAREIFETLGDERDLVNLQLEEALVLRLEGNLAGARAHLETCSERFERTGYRYAHGVASNILGDVLRMLGLLDEAVASYDEARRICALIGTTAVETDINLAIVELLRQNFERARELLTPLETLFRTSGYAVPLAYVLAGLAPCELAAGRLEAFDALSEELAALQLTAQIIDPDFATLLRTSADLLWALDDAPRGRVAYAACAAQYEALGDEESLQLATARAASWSDPS